MQYIKKLTLLALAISIIFPASLRAESDDLSLEEIREYNLESITASFEELKLYSAPKIRLEETLPESDRKVLESFALELSSRFTQIATAMIHAQVFLRTVDRRLRLDIHPEVKRRSKAFFRTAFKHSHGKNLFVPLVPDWELNDDCTSIECTIIVDDVTHEVYRLLTYLNQPLAKISRRKAHPEFEFANDFVRAVIQKQYKELLEEPGRQEDEIEAESQTGDYRQLRLAIATALLPFLKATHEPHRLADDFYEFAGLKNKTVRRVFGPTRALPMRKARKGLRGTRKEIKEFAKNASQLSIAE